MTAYEEVYVGKEGLMSRIEQEKLLRRKRRRSGRKKRTKY